METSILVTNNAKKRIEDLLSEYATDQFRVYVTGGGCSGFQYGFKFDEQSAFDDDVIDCGCFKVLLDSLSYPYLLGSELDYVEDLSGAKFVIRNPNAARFTVVNLFYLTVADYPFQSKFLTTN